MGELMSKSNLKKLISETLEEADGLVSLQGTFNTADVEFLPMLAVIFKRAYLKLHAINVLSNENLTGDAIMAISRSLLEELISVYFMQLKGKKEMAQKLSDYAYVERKLEQDVLLSAGITLDKDSVEITNKDYETVKKKFMRGKNEISRSWAKCSIEEMIKELVKADIITGDREDILTRGYIMGNRKIHLSSYDLVSYFNASIRGTVSKVSEELGMMIALICVLSLGLELARETNDAQAIKKLEVLENKLNAVLRKKK